jgi:hypothetical protein
MRRRDVITLIGGAVAAWPVVARGQHPEKVPRIGTLEYASAATSRHIWQAFDQSLRDLGYRERETIAFEHRWAEGRIERLADLAAELVRLKVDVIVAASVPGALAAKEATKKRCAHCERDGGRRAGIESVAACRRRAGGRRLRQGLCGDALGRCRRSHRDAELAVL